MKSKAVQAEEDVSRIIPTPEFDEFYFNQPERVQKKFDYVINVMATVYNVSTKFVKHLKSSDLYEMRVSIGSNEYRPYYSQRITRISLRQLRLFC